jgi:thymidylate synthase (FAD)
LKPYAELLEFNQPNLYRKPGFTRIRDAFPGLKESIGGGSGSVNHRLPWHEEAYGDFYDEAYDPERIVEFAGRWDYGENNARKLGETSKVKVADSYFSTDRMDNVPAEYKEVPIIQKYIDMGHESMLEMAWACFFLEGSRVWSHEMVRHRPVSLQQESQRFVKYDFSDDELDDFFYYPAGIVDKEIFSNTLGMGPYTGKEFLNDIYFTAAEAYKTLREAGVSPQEARYVLPNGMRTRMVFATNLREWRHICKLRLDKSAQPEMQELMQQIYDQLVDVFPNVMYNAVDGERGVR